MISRSVYLLVLLIHVSLSAQQAVSPLASATPTQPAAQSLKDSFTTAQSPNWSSQKVAYVAAAIKRPEFASSVATAERSGNVVLSPDAHIALLTEYAGAEYEVRQATTRPRQVDTQRTTVVRNYLYEIISGEKNVGFRFDTYTEQKQLFVRAHRKYGKLLITLNPPIDTFTVVIGQTSYSSERAFVLLAGPYAVVVDRRTEKCAGKVTIVATQTATFACH
jgi:hypothetical protein